MALPCGLRELAREFRGQRDGKDCLWNVIVNIPEARGLKAVGGDGLNNVKVRVSLSLDPSGFEESQVHQKTSTPFFEYVSRISYEGQPTEFFSAYLQIEMLHDRGFLGTKSIGTLQIGILDIYLSNSHKIPLQWFPLVDLTSDEPAIPTGYVRLNAIINTMDEPGAVQSDIPEEERARTELIQIPRQHAYLTATGMYNIIFKIFKGSDLAADNSIFKSADPFVRITTPTGELDTEIKTSDLNPTWNQQLQIPIFEPTFRHLLYVELWNAGPGGKAMMARLVFSWKDIYCKQDYYKQPRWYDLYSEPQKDPLGQIGDAAAGATKALTRFRAVKALSTKFRWNLKFKSGTGQYEEKSDYKGRLLFSVEVEDREGGQRPSLAQTDMKPKDCKLFLDVKQKVFFRFNVLHGQGLKVGTGLGHTHAQVELVIGRKKIACAPKPISQNGLFEWYEALELEDDVPYDDKLWPWTEEDYSAGTFPSDFIDSGFPALWIFVYRCSGVAGGVLPRQLIGFCKTTLRDLLDLGDPEEAPPKVGPEGHTPSKGHEYIVLEPKRNVIFNSKGSTRPAFFVPAAEPVKHDLYDPRNRNFKPKRTTSIPWPTHHDGRFQSAADEMEAQSGRMPRLNYMDPYKGLKCIKLEKDGKCALEPNDFAGFVWVSLKVYLPARSQCKLAKKGPPILSPFEKYTPLPIPKPIQLKCMERFELRAHIYQARDLPAANDSGVANAYVRVIVAGKSQQTHTIYMSNSPTWDCTLAGGPFKEFELPCIGWPGCEDYEDAHDTYNPLDHDARIDKMLPEYWEKNYSTLRFARRIEVQVCESVNQKEYLLGRCFINPEECFHTQQDPDWLELFKGNPEQDEGSILASFQIIHTADALHEDKPKDLIPLRTRTVEDIFGPPGSASYYDRQEFPPAKKNMEAAMVYMRECKIQVQVLGLRNMATTLGLKNPNLVVFVQTTDQHDGDPNTFRKTKECNRPYPTDPNFMDTIELDVCLPDDQDYAPDLEFLVYDQVGFFGRRKVVVWGRQNLADYYPCGEAKDEEENDDEEDPLVLKRLEMQDKEKRFRELMDQLNVSNTISALKAKDLQKVFKKELQYAYSTSLAENGQPRPVMDAFELYMKAPSDRDFIERTETFLMSDDKDASRKQKANEAKMLKEKKKALADQARVKKAKLAEDAKKAKEKERQDKELERKKEKEAKEAEKEEERKAKEAEKERKRKEKEEAALAKKEKKEAKKKGSKGDSAEGQNAPDADGPGSEDGGRPKPAEPDSDVKDARTEDIEISVENLPAIMTEADLQQDSADEGPSPEIGAGPTPASRGDSPEGQEPGEQADVVAETGEEAQGGNLDGDLPDAPGVDEAQAGPVEPDRHQGDNPNLAHLELQNEDTGDDGREGGGGAGVADKVDESLIDQYGAVLPEDDEEPDRQEEVDTPDGKPNAEWLIFRKHPPFQVPLEETDEWGPDFDPSFDEIKLFKGRVRDYKRRDTESLGIVKCRIKIFRREKPTVTGLTEAGTEPKYYEVKPEHVDIESSLTNDQVKYKQYNINETYPESNVEVRVYCLKAFQVTPGGYGRADDGGEYWLHYLRCTLGIQSEETDVVKSLNPNFFHVFQFKNCLLPGPSQLEIALYDADLAHSGAVADRLLIGSTTVDLEDRWFCLRWRDEKYKPREVRDLTNEDPAEAGYLPGISQGKLALFVDVMEQNKADENPPEDIQVLGKTLPMELRLIVWNTADTAGKDGYSSDVFLTCEMMGVGSPKQTDTHKGVKLKALGMFHYRLKWRCRYPNPALEYLMRIQVWDENMLTSNQNIAEGVLPLKSLFKECFERNQGKTSPDEMEKVELEDENHKNQLEVDEEGIKYPYQWYQMVHPNFGFNPAKDAQAKIQISVQILPRAKARASPAGSKRNGPSKLRDPPRPPQPANPILESEKCRAYIVYTISEFCGRYRTCCCCLLCIILFIVIIVVVFYVQQIFPALPL